MEKSSFDKITLVQPNKVTNARYNYNELQENILTLVMSSLQKHLSREQPLSTDLFGDPLITITVDEKIGGSKANKAQYIKAAEGIGSKMVNYEWRNKEDKKVKTSAAMFSAVHDVEYSKSIQISLNKWSLPYLLYWGKGVGGTIFNKSIALTLRGSYTKRLYKMCMQWKAKGYFGMPIEDFRKQLFIEDKYPRKADLIKRVLSPAQERMKEKADVYFEFRFDKIGKSRSYNYIHFTIKENAKTGKERTELYMTIYNILSIAFPPNKSSRTMDICEKMSNKHEDFDKLYRRLIRLRYQLGDGKIDYEDVSRLIKHIMKEDFPNY